MPNINPYPVQATKRAERQIEVRHYYDDAEVCDRARAWSDRQPMGAIVTPAAAARAIRATRPPPAGSEIGGVLLPPAKYGARTIAVVLCRYGWQREWDGLHKVVDALVTI